jgi:phosphoenolpyruvate carboxylase
MASMSQAAYRAYRSLVYETPGFVDYFTQATPITALMHLRIGSRPAKRQQSQPIEDLRAIPWIFAWMQSRHALPSWYGLGMALRTFAHRAPENLSRLRAMYQEWPFLQALIDNAAMALARRIWTSLARTRRSWRTAAWPMRPSDALRPSGVYAARSCWP